MFFILSIFPWFLPRLFCQIRVLKLGEANFSVVYTWKFLKMRYQLKNTEMPKKLVFNFYTFRGLYTEIFEILFSLLTLSVVYGFLKIGVNISVAYTRRFLNFRVTKHGDAKKIFH